MNKRFKSGWLAGLFAFAVVGTVVFFILGENLGGSGWMSALIFLAILLGFAVVSSWGSDDKDEEEEDG